MPHSTRSARIEETPDAGEDRLKIAVVGHVDHGKSTVLARLMHDTGQISPDRLERVKAACEAQGKQLEYAFLLDALEEEQAQGITIDVSYISWRTPGKQITFIDAPGHREFLKNMVSGAASAEAALLVIDANEGVCEQSRRHGFILDFLGIDRVVVAVNKMDLVGYSAEAFGKIVKEYTAFLADLGIKALNMIPVSGINGDLITGSSENMPWYTGPSLAETLMDLPDSVDADLPFRFNVQGVYKFDQRRIIAGRVESGSVAVGDDVICMPSQKRARVRAIERWSVPGELDRDHAWAGESVGLTFVDQIFIERGELIAHLGDAPKVSNSLHAKVLWMSDNLLASGTRYELKLGTQSVPAVVERIVSALDTVTLQRTESQGIERNQVGEVVFRLTRPLAFDDYAQLPRTGRFVIAQEGLVVGGGIIDMQAYPDLSRQLSDQPVSQNITLEQAPIRSEERFAQQGYPGLMVWMTGLSGSGKSTLAGALARALFSKGVNAFVLDGDNLRHGLNSDLGFSPDDRAENVRRVAEVARLMQQSGVIVISALISPYQSGRDFARSLAPEHFLEIFVDCPLEACEERDVKGLYKKAKAGEIQGFTGISSPYEAPESPELRIPTAEMTEEESLALLLTKLAEYGVPLAE